MSGPPLTVEQCVEKWSQLLEGLDDVQAPVVAWCIEREARYLVKYLPHRVRQARERLRNNVIKRTFPALRLAIVEMFPASAVDRLARITRRRAGEIDEEEVRAAIGDGLWRVADAEAVITQYPLMSEKERHLVRVLADRVLESLRAYPGSGGAGGSTA
ncbi:MAG TPA: hypothetical protein VMW52_05110 [Phycisphaerae bacterium]|nr:hypothetical protein [Phycisphaerae bacterium]